MPTGTVPSNAPGRLEGEGAKWLGVTSLDEAIPLRDAGIRGEYPADDRVLAR